MPKRTKKQPGGSSNVSPDAQARIKSMRDPMLLVEQLATAKSGTAETATAALRRACGMMGMNGDDWLGEYAYRLNAEENAALSAQGIDEEDRVHVHVMSMSFALVFALSICVVCRLTIWRIPLH